MTPASPRFFGSTVVSAAFVVAVFGWGLGFYGPPIYLEAVRAARGWSVALVSAAVTVHFLIGALVVLRLPGWHARYGLPAVTVAGSVALALGVMGWAAAREPWQLFFATLLSGGGWVALGAAGVNAIVSPWFVRRRPAALSLAYNGASVGGVIFSPLWVALDGSVGFLLGATLVGAVMVAVISALAFCVLGRRPEDMGQAPDGEPPGSLSMPAQAINQPAAVAGLRRDRAFRTLALGMSLALFAQIGLLTHLFSLLAPTLGAQGAGLAAGLATAAAILGRTLVGWLMPAAADRRLVGTANLGVQMLGCGALLLAAGSSVPLLLAGVVLVGLGIGNATSLPPLIAQVEFAKQDVPRVVATIVATAQAAYAFAPAVFGLLRDLVGPGGGSAAVFVAAAAVQIAAGLAYMSGRRAYATRASIS